MPARLSRQFKTTGMFGSSRGRYGNQGTGPNYLTNAYPGDGYYWDMYPGVVGGMNTNGTGMAVDPGTPMNTYLPTTEESFTKGDRQADAGATTNGNDMGGTAAY
ncbi:hypothetical protein UFOVP46_121 [uncultured Caudovirales phage]|uniref:Uncharacterized protein n=1 Tax=uncultured Caudovirales phage TaxID=2100421 RepID=A0A6J5KPU0_9CAUD|nr:hypothetical protein UFOVP46_121 [uncultured Caudovirales phage]